MGFATSGRLQSVAIERTCKVPLRFTLKFIATATVFGKHIFKMARIRGYADFLRNMFEMTC